MCKHCRVGLLETGIGRAELTMEQYREDLKREPVMTPKKFKRFNFCPYCGREIGWGRENEKTD